MNPVSDELFKKANEAAIYNLYLYLAHITAPYENATLGSVIEDLESKEKKRGWYVWNSRDIERLGILSNFVKRNAFLANSRISNFFAAIQSNR